MRKQIPKSVQEAIDGGMVPTPPLADYIKADEIDDNTFWRLGCGHHQNLLDAALERIEVLESMYLDAFRTVGALTRETE